MSDEVLAFVGVTVGLLIGAVLTGAWAAGRRRWGPAPLVGVLVAAVTTLAVITGPFGGRSLAVTAAALLWGVLLLVTAVAVGRLRPRPAVVAAALGGVVAAQAAMIAFVLARFSATEAPREYALLWLPAAMTGAVRDLGGPGGDADTPLWVRMSVDAGLLPILAVLLSGFALAYAVRRGADRRSPT